MERTVLFCCLTNWQGDGPVRRYSPKGPGPKNDAEERQILLLLSYFHDRKCQVVCYKSGQRRVLYCCEVCLNAKIHCFSRFLISFLQRHRRRQDGIEREHVLNSATSKERNLSNSDWTRIVLQILQGLRHAGFSLRALGSIKINQHLLTLSHSEIEFHLPGLAENRIPIWRWSLRVLDRCKPSVWKPADNKRLYKVEREGEGLL